MYIVRIIPVSRGIAKEELSYFSAVAYPEGSIVSVLVRNRTVPGVVVGNDAISPRKSELKTHPYALKKIRKQRPRVLVTRAFIRAVIRTADHAAATPGAVLFSYLPQALLKDEYVGEEPVDDVVRTTGFVVPRVLQAPTTVRIDYYRTTVREAFAQHCSVFILTPTIAEAEQIETTLARGIEEHTYMLHSELTHAKQRQVWRKVCASTHPVLIIGTAQFLSVPRHDLAVVIVERESASAYVSRSRPHADARILAHALAAERNGTLHLADLPLRIETYSEKERGLYEEITTGHQRTRFTSRARIVSQKPSADQKKPFRALGDEALSALDSALMQHKNAFIYVARRGLSPITVCRDCGQTVACKECAASVVLHKGKEENYFLCHSCGAMRHAREVCVACRSWRLESLGIGTELVAQELNGLFPNHPTFLLTGEQVKTHKQATQCVQTFLSEKGALLVGTELALAYLTQTVSLSVVASLDSLLAIPSWSMYERIASILTRLRDRTESELLVQTRRPEADILHMIINGDFTRYYRTEKATRERFGYPPFTTIIRLSATGSQKQVLSLIEHATETLKPHELIPFSRLLRAPKGAVTLHAFLRVPKDRWPDTDVLEKIRSLPPGLEVVVDPEHIL